MIVYNVTVNIDYQVHDAWLKWMKEEHIPAVMNTGQFVSYRFCRIHAEEEGGRSYAIQYVCEGVEQYNNYQQSFAKGLQQEHEAKFGGHYAAFRTLLEIVDESK